ncbi:MAG: ATP synthase F1 subunit gamma [Alphaproteobacteria bacterium]|jgi:F-type H+-transporting ATPase subunit gamma|nr:ATP synthase F1 subunit gamma [Alphaproteobacteria bacterium]MBT5389615.1 ATP synthase F1 subunit gamma [Alphaproteobacteria bacterium]MBT5540724.1 ATP synthase F1 subunit gamma [Alphaproteobacteria bacterium]MBT5654859.1 ATP synthase F1 subunit gamma [Alphaproteobacteria bacterium]
MATLKELRTRTNSVQSTKKITTAMKLVAASKFRRAQDQLESGRHYVDAFEHQFQALATTKNTYPLTLPLFIGRPEKAEKTHLFIVVTSDRGLCGGFNGVLLRRLLIHIKELEEKGSAFKILTIGQKAKSMLRRNYGDRFHKSYVDVGNPALKFREAQEIAAMILVSFDNEEFDTCDLYFNKFHSAMKQTPTCEQLIPFKAHEEDESPTEIEQTRKEPEALCELEPKLENFLKDMIPHHIATRLYMSFLETAAGEQGARMLAMDSATRNADDMIKGLNLSYNRIRQASITRELIEIISGAEAI